MLVRDGGTDKQKLLNSTYSTLTGRVGSGTATTGCCLDATSSAVLLLGALSAEQLLSAEGVLPAQVSKHLRLCEPTQHKEQPRKFLHQRALLTDFVDNLCSIALWDSGKATSVVTW